MERWKRAVALVALGGALYACGGGGGGGGGGASPKPGTAVPTAVLSASYAGTYVDRCQAADGATRADTGQALYTRSVLTIDPVVEAVAQIHLRFDFFDTATCTGAGLGSLTYQFASAIALRGSATVHGKQVDKLLVTLGTPLETPSSSAGGSSRFGNGVQLSVPTALFSATTFGDVWLLDGDTLVTGNDVIGPDGYPTGLDFVAASTRTTTPPDAPQAACTATARSWFVGGSPACSASLPGAPSGTSTVLQSSAASTAGSATFACTNGTWSAPASASCALAAPPPLPGACASSPQSWTVNGRTCTGTIGAANDGQSLLIGSVAGAGTGGVASFTCTGAAFRLDWGTCDVIPPAPVLTDPVQIAQQKNCTVCHAVSDPTQSVGGVSFQAIADHYRGSTPAAGVLEAKVKAGGVGTFGTLPMPANPQISDAELAIVLPWILAR